MDDQVSKPKPRSPAWQGVLVFSLFWATSMLLAFFIHKEIHEENQTLERKLARCLENRDRHPEIVEQIRRFKEKKREHHRLASLIRPLSERRPSFAELEELISTRLPTWLQVRTIDLTSDKIVLEGLCTKDAPALTESAEAQVRPFVGSLLPLFDVENAEFKLRKNSSSFRLVIEIEPYPEARS